MKVPKKWLILGAGLLCCCALGLWRLWPWLSALTRPETAETLRGFLDGLGVWGALALLILQALQVLSALIPALPIQLAAGAAYGPVGGLAICLGGVALGSSLVFGGVKKWGKPLVDRVFPLEKQQRISFLSNARQLNFLTFLLYLLPALPKDVFNYLAALTPLTLRRFLSILIVARTPTILGNTFASSALLAGDTTASILVFCFTGGLGLLCMIFCKPILSWMERHSH